MADLIPGTFGNSLDDTIGSRSAGDNITIPPASSVDYTIDLNIADVELGTFIVAAGCRSSFGGPTGGVQINLSAASYAGTLRYAGSGAHAYFDPTTKIARTVIEDTGGGTFYGLTGEWTSVEQGAGQSRFSATADVIDAKIMGGNCHVEPMGGQAVDTGVIGPRGTLRCQRNIGALTVQGTLIVDERAVDATTLTLMPGSRTIWQGDDITNLIVYGSATLDLSGVSQVVTITALTKYGEGLTIIPSPTFPHVISGQTLYAGATKE